MTDLHLPQGARTVPKVRAGVFTLPFPLKPAGRAFLLAVLALPSVAYPCDTELLTCTVGKNDLTICLGDDDGRTVRYSFGPTGHPDLTLSEAVSTVDFLPWNGIGSAPGDLLTFHNGRYSYGVAVTLADYDGGPVSYDVHINVDYDGALLAQLFCSEQLPRDPFGPLRQAKHEIGQCWNLDERRWTTACTPQ